MRKCVLFFLISRAECLFLPVKKYANIANEEMCYVRTDKAMQTYGAFSELASSTVPL